MPVFIVGIALGYAVRAIFYPSKLEMASTNVSNLVVWEKNARNIARLRKNVPRKTN